MQINVNSLNKAFRVPIKEQGRKASFKYFFKRTYREVSAIKDLSFSLSKGELVGYLGPNGAGKSTTLKILTGIMTPDSGRVTIDGIIPYENRRRHVANIGVVFGQKSQLWWDLPLIDSFKLLKAIYKVPDTMYKRQYHWLVEGLNIDAYIMQPVRLLSLGQRMRAELVASLLHCPKILFLDEPTIGLDATSKLTVRSFIKTLNREFGTTVILTTHDMEDIKALSERVIVIDQGKLGFDGSLNALRKKVDNQRVITIDFNGVATFSFHQEIRLISCDKGRASFKFNPDRIPSHHVVGWLCEQVEPVDVLIEPLPIEEVVSKLYGEQS